MVEDDSSTIVKSVFCRLKPWYIPSALSLHLRKRSAHVSRVHTQSFHGRAQLLGAMNPTRLCSCFGLSRLCFGVGVWVCIRTRRVADDEKNAYSPVFLLPMTPKLVYCHCSRADSDRMREWY